MNVIFILKFEGKRSHFLSSYCHFPCAFAWVQQHMQVPRGLHTKLVGPDDQATPLMMENSGTMYISKNSPKEVVEAYASQFKEDFGTFLESRSEEMVCGGRMVLSLMGRTKE